MTNTVVEPTQDVRPDAKVFVTTENFLLSAQDRCDACGAQAYYRVTLSPSELLFCAHHYTLSKEKLLKIAVSVHDESAQLYR